MFLFPKKRYRPVWKEQIFCLRNIHHIKRKFAQIMLVVIFILAVIIYRTLASIYLFRSVWDVSNMKIIMTFENRQYANNKESNDWLIALQTAPQTDLVKTNNNKKTSGKYSISISFWSFESAIVKHCSNDLQQPAHSTCCSDPGQLFRSHGWYSTRL